MLSRLKISDCVDKKMGRVASSFRNLKNYFNVFINVFMK